MSRFHLWINVLIIAFILQSSVEGSPVRQLILCDGERVEPFVKSLVTNATALLPNPILLPEQAGFVTLTEGTLIGLSSLSPNRSTKITCKEDESLIEIRTHLNAKAVKAKYKWLRTILTRTLHGSVTLTANTFEAFIRIRQDMNEKNEMHPVVKACEVRSLEDIDVDVTGEQYITWPTEKITDPAINTFKEVVYNTIKGSFKKAIAKQLNAVTLTVKN